MGIKVANNAFATLASGISNSATSITLTTGQGARFPSLGAGDYFYATLIDTSNNLEIVKCTARSTDVLTVVRAQESTTARAYSAGDRIEIRLTAATFTDATQALPTQTGNAGKYLKTDGTNATWETVSVTPTAISDQTNSSTGYFDLPAGTTAQRPGSPGSGMVRFNTTLGEPEWYDPAGAQWLKFSQGANYSVEYLVVAGGGSGSGGNGGGAGGGGAGGLLTGTATLTSTSTHPITVGAGGAATTSSSGGNNGSNSAFASFATAIGGGGGGANSMNGKSGGSGGGSGEYVGNLGGSGTSGQGNAGGSTTFTGSGSGGGGAGGAGTNGGSGGNVNGGIGAIWPAGSGTYYAGGGGASTNGAPGGTGGLGGGGNGGPGSGGSGTVTSGAANTGGGGGGTYLSGAGTASGGSGIVIIRYTGTPRGSGGTVTQSGGYTYHTFTSSGTFTA